VKSGICGNRNLLDSIIYVQPVEAPAGRKQELQAQLAEEKKLEQELKQTKQQIDNKQ